MLTEIACRHVRPSARFVELRQKAFAAGLTKRSSSTNLAALLDDGEREEKIRNANSDLRDKTDADMGSRRRSHVNFDELLVKSEGAAAAAAAAPLHDGAQSPKKGAEVKPVKSD